jgi:hypothetical protein
MAKLTTVKVTGPPLGNVSSSPLPRKEKKEVVVGDGRKCRSYRELMAKKKKKRTDELMR